MLRDTFLAGGAMAAGTTKLLVLPSVWIWNYFYVVVLHIARTD
jgi:hypothetical protein